MASLVQELRRTLEDSDPLLSNETRRILLKTALQGYVLDYIYNHRLYRELNFYGGTCLYVLYDLNRLSEDIDLDNSEEVDLGQLAPDLLGYFRSRLDYREVSLNEQTGDKGILRITMKFPFLYDLELTPHRDEKLHLKLEISLHHQVAEVKHTPVIYQGRSFVAAHFSKETMMAGKMLACLERSFQKGDTGTKIKGRDFYDLLWFMQQRTQPLENKLVKDGIRSYTLKEVWNELRIKVKAIKHRDLALDLYPLFENRAFIEAWIDSFHENFLDYLKYYESEGGFVQ